MAGPLGDITVQVALDDARFLRGLDQVSRKAEGFGRTIDKTFKAVTTGFVGVVVFQQLSAAVRAAAAANEDYAATWTLIADQAKSLQLAVGGTVFDKLIAVGDFLTGGAITENADASRVDKMAKASLDAAAAAAKQQQEERQRAEEDRRRFVEDQQRATATALALAEREATEAELLAGYDQDRVNVAREELAIARDRDRLRENLKGLSDAEQAQALDQFDATAARRLSVAEREAAQAATERANAAQRAYRTELASLEIAARRASGDEAVADEAERLMDAERRIDEIRARRDISSAQRERLVAAVKAATLAEASAAASGRRERGPGAGPALAGTATLGGGAVLAQTLGGAAGTSVERDQLAEMKRARELLDRIDRSLTSVQRSVHDGGGGARWGQ